MKAYVICVRGAEADPVIESASRTGHVFDVAVWIATRCPLETLRQYGLNWNHPEKGERLIGGLRCHAYRSSNINARISCFLAHFELWGLCERIGEPVLVLESDALFTRRFDPAELNGSQYGMVSLNDPRGATRKAGDYHQQIQARGHYAAVIEAPWVDDDLTIPQGLPGHSAYVIQPWFAAEIIEGIERRGAMPNDTAVCRQWYPGKLGCLTRYATKVSGRPSTLA